MKKCSSIKIRITLWYTSLMLVLISVVLGLIGILSYQLLIDNIENNLKANVSQVSEKIERRNSADIFYAVESNKDFKNVSIYQRNGEYVVGQNVYDISNIEFKDDEIRRETVDGKDYIVYDLYKSVGMMNGNYGYWIRGVESINSTTLLGRSVFIVLLIIIPVLLLLTALGGYYITRKAFLPINQIIKTANAIYTQNDITKRIPIHPGERNDELQNLSITLNEMLDKIQQLMVREKQFTSDAAHELRTPISVILAQGEYLLELAENEKQKELAEAIVAKGKQTSELLSKLLLLARMDSGRQSFHKEMIDVNELIDVAVEEMQSFAQEKNITISVQTRYNTLLSADEALLRTALKNLISNAVKYGKESGNIDIGVDEHPAGVQITVADDGIGIAPEHIGMIWERFYRVDDVRNDAYGSCGLGLSMVKSIIDLHEGTIAVKSELGKGTEFQIILKK